MATLPTRLRAHHLAAARLYAAGWRRREIAETLSLHPSTLSHWMKAAAFAAAVREAQNRFREVLMKAIVKNIVEPARCPRCAAREAHSQGTRSPSTLMMTK